MSEIILLLVGAFIGGLIMFAFMGATFFAKTISVNAIKTVKNNYLNPKRVLSEGDLVPFSSKGYTSYWHDVEIISDEKSVFSHAWERIKNGKNFHYFINDYIFSISFDGGDFGWVEVNMSTGQFTICVHKTGARHHLPYNSEKNVYDFCPEIVKWYVDIHNIAKAEWVKDNNL